MALVSMFLVEAAGLCRGCLQLQGSASEHLDTESANEAWQNFAPPGQGNSKNKEYLLLFMLGDPDCLFTVSQTCSYPLILALLQRAPWSIPTFIYWPYKSK